MPRHSPRRRRPIPRSGKSSSSTSSATQIPRGPRLPPERREKGPRTPLRSAGGKHDHERTPAAARRGGRSRRCARAGHSASTRPRGARRSPARTGGQGQRARGPTDSGPSRLDAGRCPVSTPKNKAAPAPAKRPTVREALERVGELLARPGLALREHARDLVARVDGVLGALGRLRRLAAARGRALHSILCRLRGHASSGSGFHESYARLRQIAAAGVRGRLRRGNARRTWPWATGAVR